MFSIKITQSQKLKNFELFSYLYVHNFAKNQTCTHIYSKSRQICYNVVKPVLNILLKWAGVCKWFLSFFTACFNIKQLVGGTWRDAAESPPKRNLDKSQEYLDSEMSDVSRPLERVVQRVLLNAKSALLGRLLVGGEVADGLAGGGAAYRQQQKNITRAVLELAPQSVSRLALEICQIDHRAPHQIVLVTAVSIPHCHL